MIPVTDAQTACPPSAEIRRAYVAAVGDVPLGRYHLIGHGGISRYEAWIGDGNMVVSRADGSVMQIWSDDASGSTHTFWNGFEGRAAPWRASLRKAAIAALLGSLADRAPAAASCPRIRRIRYRSLRFDDHGLDIRIRLNRQTSLPAAIFAADGHHGVEINDIQYRQIGSAFVPIAWQFDDNRFEFQFVDRSDDDGAPQVHGRAEVMKSFIVPTRPGRRPYETTVAVTIDGHPHRFLLDTGANGTVLNDATAARVKLVRLGRTYFRGANGPHEAGLALLRDMRIGEIAFDDEPVLVTSQTFGYDGLIGLSLFALGAVRFEHNRIVVSPRSEIHDSRPAVALDTFDGVPVASARVGQEEAQVLLDTGAAFEALLPYRFLSGAARISQGTTACRIYGIPPFLVAGYYAVRRLELGTYPWPIRGCISNIEAAGATGYEGILGQPSVFRDGVTLDYRGGVLMPPRTGTGP